MKRYFDIEKAVRIITDMNKSHAVAAGDWLLHKAFPNLEKALEPKTIAERVVLIDGLWRTNLTKEDGAADRVIKNIVSQRDFLKSQLAGLHTCVLKDNHECVWEVAKAVLPVVLEQPSDSPSNHRENFSFATKFFHWCTRNHFPIVDNNARRRISELQERMGARKGIKANSPGKGKRLDEYRLWIEFYNDLIRSLGPDDHRKLERADYDSLPRQFRFKNSLLRILDKYFWWRGQES